MKLIAIMIPLLAAGGGAYHWRKLLVETFSQEEAPTSAPAGCVVIAAKIDGARNTIQLGQQGDHTGLWAANNLWHEAVESIASACNDPALPGSVRAWARILKEDVKDIDAGIENAHPDQKAEWGDSARRIIAVVAALRRTCEACRDDTAPWGKAVVRSVIEGTKDVIQTGKAGSATGLWASNRRWKRAVAALTTAGQECKDTLPNGVYGLIESLGREAARLSNAADAHPKGDRDSEMAAEAIIATVKKIAELCR